MLMVCLNLNLLCNCEFEGLTMNKKKGNDGAFHLIHNLLLLYILLDSIYLLLNKLYDLK